MVYKGIRIPERAKESLARMCLEKLIDRFYETDKNVQEMIKELERLERRYTWLVSKGEKERAIELRDRIEELQHEIEEEEKNFILDLIRKLS